MKILHLIALGAALALLPYAADAASRARRAVKTTPPRVCRSDPVPSGPARASIVIVPRSLACDDQARYGGRRMTSIGSRAGC
jgi:hypothetical protein